MTDRPTTTTAADAHADADVDVDAAADLPDGNDGPGYAAALDELDDILRELEGADVDVDRLATRVARAAELITLCRRRIGDARLRIDEVVADLDAGSDHEATESPGRA